MMDKTLEFVEIIMKRKSGRVIHDYYIPDGYKIVMFKPGNETDWADIESSVEEFNTYGDALTYFKKHYLSLEPELIRRCMFIEDSNGNKVATLTAWWEYVNNRRRPWISWVAVKPEHQGKGLGKALISRGLYLLRELEGDVDFFLKTQTWSYKAINIYRYQGFRIQNEIGDVSLGNLSKRRAKKVLKGLLK